MKSPIKVTETTSKERYIKGCTPPKRQERGHWKKAEKICLIQGTREFGRKWSKIVKKYFITEGKETRTAEKCRSYYNSHRKKLEKMKIPLTEQIPQPYVEPPPPPKTSLWTKEDKVLLIQGMREYGHQWVKIAENTFNLLKTPKQCIAYFKKYQNELEEIKLELNDIPQPLVEQPLFNLTAEPYIPRDNVFPCSVPLFNYSDFRTYEDGFFNVDELDPSIFDGELTLDFN